MDKVAPFHVSIKLHVRVIWLSQRFPNFFLQCLFLTITQSDPNQCWLTVEVSRAGCTFFFGLLGKFAAMQLTYTPHFYMLGFSLIFL